MTMRKIEYRNEGSQETYWTPIDEIPPHLQSACFKEGLLVDSESAADEVVPVTRVLITPRNTEGEVVPQEQASEIIIREYGENDRLLRETLLLAE